MKKFNYKFYYLLLLFTPLFLYSCSDDDEPHKPPVVETNTDDEYDQLSSFQKNTIAYFQEIALGSEFGNTSKVTRKWKDPMKIYLDGENKEELINELHKVISEINDLVTDGFTMEITDNKEESNYYIYLGSHTEYTKLNPNLAELILDNWGLFNIQWDNQNVLIAGNMYVDLYRPNLKEQKHLLREEFTQSLGLPRDSYKYNESIFQQRWTSTNYYNTMDKELIRLLYHPKMKSGLNAKSAKEVLIQIYLSEAE